MSEKEKKAIERLNLKAITSSIEAPNYPNAIVMKRDLVTVLNLIDKQQKEIEVLKLDLEEMVKSNNYKKENWVHKNILNSYISKYKIREKIKELENDTTNKFLFKLSSADIRNIIVINLKELLQEGDKYIWK